MTTASGKEIVEQARFWVPPLGLMTQEVFFTREDSHAFGEALKAAFPFVAFCSHGRLPHLRTKFHVTLGELWEGHYLIYVSDEDGERSFDPGNPPAKVWNSNRPRWRLYYVAAHDPRGQSEYQNSEDLSLKAGYVGVQYTPGDAESLVFAEQVMAIVESVTTKRLERFSPHSGEPLALPEPARRMRAGHYAVRWTLKDPRRVMGYECRYHPRFTDAAYRPVA